MGGLNFFDKMFDFNHDGKLGAFETGAKWGTIAHIMDDGSKVSDSSYGASFYGSYDVGFLENARERTLQLGTQFGQAMKEKQLFVCLYVFM